MKWQQIESAPRTGKPFWLGTGSGGVLLEAWHWCSELDDFAGCYSRTTLTSLRRDAPNERLLWTEMQAPKSKLQ